MCLLDVQVITRWNLIHFFLQCWLRVVSAGEGADSAEATGNQSRDLPTIYLCFLIGISFLKQRSTMLGHQGFGRSVKEAEEIGSGGRRAQRRVHFPGSHGRCYQVLTSGLWEKYYHPCVFVFCKQCFLSTLAFFSASGKERCFFWIFMSCVIKHNKSAYAAAVLASTESRCFVDALLKLNFSKQLTAKLHLP